jgi:phenylacetate-CoA ligase
MTDQDWLSGLVAHAYEHAPAVRATFESARLTPKDITSRADLERIPITRKDALIELQALSPPFGGFLAIPEEQVVRVFMSPGPLFDPQGPTEDYWRFGQALRAAGFVAGDVVLNASSYHLSPMGVMLDDAARALGCVVIPSGTGNSELQVVAARAVSANAYCGTPSFLKALLDKGLAVSKAFVAGEMLPETLRAQITAHGVDVFQGYGTADLGLLGFECTERNGFHVADGAIVEIVDGEIVATVNSRTYPLIRFGTGDLSELNQAPCACGRTSARLNGIQGRLGDGVKVRGMFVHPRQLDEVLKGLGRYEAIVDRVDDHDTFVVRVEATHAPVELEARLSDVLRVKADVELVRPGTLGDGDGKRLIDRRTWAGVR